MLSWIEVDVGVTIFIGILLYFVVKQVEKLLAVLGRIEARLALIKPLASELDVLDEIEEQANFGSS
jgi:hypothetical protein